MAVELVKKHFEKHHKNYEIKELTTSSATVELAARALAIEEDRIAKTLAFYTKEGGCILVVTSGKAKIDNHKFKEEFGLKARMVKVEDVETLTNHPVGGVCPFGNPEGTPVYLDRSLMKYATVFPACGSTSTAIEIKPEELFSLADAHKWIDVCKFLPQ